MLSNEALEKKLEQVPGILKVEAKGDGYHYSLLVVSNIFIGKSKVARQQWIYSLLKDDITSGSLHALSMKTLTQEEWEKQGG